MRLRAEYRCLTCKHEWTQPDPGIVTCPRARCGSTYVEWVNWAKMERDDERFKR